MIDYDVVATGSTGNLVLLEKKIAIDVGVSYKVIEPYMDGIKLVLLTHQHSDHFRASTIRRMALEKPLLRFGCGPFLARKVLDAGVAKGQIDVLRPNILYGYGICNVIPFEVYHDVPNYGYKVHFPHGKVFYATDLGNTAGLTARGYDLIMLESNYEDSEIKARMDAKIARGEFPYERRAMQYHLSKQQCDNFVYANNPKEYVYLHSHIDREADDESADR